MPVRKLAVTDAVSSRPNVPGKERAGEGAEEPDELLCPITRTMFRDPVVNLAGHTYERGALEQYWRSRAGMRAQFTDPNTNTAVRNGTLIANWDKRKAVARWLEEHPDSVPDGWESREVSAPDTAPAESSNAPATNWGGAVLQGFGAQGQSWQTVIIALLVAAAWLYGVTSGFTHLEDTDSSGGAVPLLLFSIFWNGFVGLWTTMAVSAGAPILFPLFSLPFWAVGGAILRQGLQMLV